MRSPLAPALLVAIALAPPRARQAPAVVPCDVRAYVIDRDPKGLNVRAGPGAAHRVVGTLPTEAVDGVGVHVSGGSGEWVRIDRATQQGGDEDRTLFSGEGWVYGPLLGTDGVGWIAGGTPLRAEPSRTSRVVARMAAGGDGAVVRGCRGRWALVEHHRVRGWAERDALCDNALTTCS